MFCELNNDGFTLSKQRTPIDGNQIPELTKAILKFKNDNIISDNIYAIPKQEIIENNYDLSINKYREIEQETIQYEEPKELLNKIKLSHKKCEELLSKLEGLL